jgi:hypothetical protein
MRSSEYLEALVREIQSHGVTTYEIKQRGGNHPQLVFQFRNQTIKFVHACSVSDWRAQENALSALRRVMGVQRQIIKSDKHPDERRKVKKHSTPIPLPKLANVVIPDEFQKLAVLRDRPTAGVNDNAPIPDGDSRVPLIPLRTPWLGHQQRWQEAA